MRSVKIQREWVWVREACDCCGYYDDQYIVMVNGRYDGVFHSLQEALERIEHGPYVFEYIYEPYPIYEEETHEGCYCETD